jgi:type IV pilus assembly protein PilW
MKISSKLNQKGITLIELLVALVICAMAVAGIYKLFISQTKAYTVQDQVVEVQQTIRSAMEILLRDLRMTGFDDDKATQAITVPSPPVTPNIIGGSSIRLFYEYHDPNTNNRFLYRVDYWRDAGTASLIRELDRNDGSPVERSTLLENVDALTFTYGVDSNEDGFVENWVSGASVGSLRVVAVRVTLTARPAQVNPDLQMIAPRTLVSTVTLRNLCLIR